MDISITYHSRRIVGHVIIDKLNIASYRKYKIKFLGFAVGPPDASAINNAAAMEWSSMQWRLEPARHIATEAAGFRSIACLRFPMVNNGAADGGSNPLRPLASGGGANENRGRNR